MRDILEVLAEDLRQRGQIDLSEGYIDGTFVVAKKAGQSWVLPSGVKGTKLMALTDAFGLPVAAYTTSASPAEVSLVQATLEKRFLAQKPEHIVGDKAYDIDPLDEQLAAQGIEMVAPHRRGRKKVKTQDGRTLRRCRRRWKAERLFAWLHSFRRILTRHEHRAENHLGFVHLGCIKILLRRYL